MAQLAPDGAENAPWLLRPVPRPDAVWRILCFPHAGGSAHAYLPWCSWAPPDTEVAALRVPGRGDRVRERSVEALDALASEVASVVDVFDPTTLALFGHSFGSLVAFEVCRELRRRGRPLPRALFVSGRKAPSAPASLPLLHQLPKDDLIEQLQLRYGRTVPERVLQDAQLAHLLLPALRNDLRADELYSHRAEAPLDCPIFVFAGAGDTSLSRGTVESWGRETSRAFCVRWWRGGHFYIDDHGREVVELMRAFLGHVDERGS